MPQEPDLITLIPDTVQYEAAGIGAGWNQVRQILTFVHSPATAKRRVSTGTVLVEIGDGRIFFLKVGTLRLGNIHHLIRSLFDVPQWYGDWNAMSVKVGYWLGCSIEFINSSPFVADEWGIGDWERQAMAKALVQPNVLSLNSVREDISQASNTIRGDLLTGLRTFLARIDPMAVDRAGQDSVSWCNTYNYYGACTAKNKLYRRQSDTTFPLVTRYLHQYPASSQSESIRLAIDDGVPMVDALSDIFNCSKASIKHLNGLDVNEVGSNWDGKLKELLQILSFLDVNLLPRGSEAWKVFAEGVELISSITKLPIMALSSRVLLRDMSRNHWDCRSANLVSFQERAIAIEEFGECVRQAIITTTWSLGLEDQSISARSRKLATDTLCEVGLNRIEKISRKWKRFQLSERLEVPSGDDSFPVLLEQPIKVGALHVIQLTNTAQLKQEGRLMDNCVGGYGDQCMSGSAYIFSVRDRDDKPLATVEYAFRKAKYNLPEFFLVQQKGKNNRKPPENCVDALKCLHEILESASIRKRIQTMAIYRKGFERAGKEMAKRLADSTRVVEFLSIELPGRINFEQLARSSSRESGMAGVSDRDWGRRKTILDERPPPRLGLLTPL